MVAQVGLVLGSLAREKFVPVDFLDQSFRSQIPKPERS